METAQVQKLKLNVTNINSFLVNSNKDLRRLRVEKGRLLNTQEKQIKVKEREDKIEKKDLGIGSSFKKIKNAIMSGPMSIFDKIKEFFSLILLGILINNLPKILSQLENFFNSPVIKTIGSIISVIGNGIMTFAKIAIEFPKSAQTQFLKTKDDLEKKFDEIENIYSALIPNLEKYNKQQNGQSPSTQTPTNQPTKPTFQNTAGYGRYSPAVVQQGYKQNPDPGVPVKLASGGTVKPESSRKVTSSVPTPGGGQTGRAKQARQASDQGFTGFKDAVDKINENAKLDEKNITAFEKMSYNFKTLTSLMSGKTPSTTPPGPPGSTPPGSTPPGSTPPGSTPGSKEFPYSSPTGDATIKIYPGQGRDASGEPGLDFSFKDYKSNYSLFAGEVIDKPVYSGYGQSLRIRSKDPATGKMFDALYAHFPPGGVRVKVGDKVTPGQFLGPVGWDHKNNRAIRGSGNMDGPHTSVDFFEPGTLRPYSNAGGVTNSVIRREGKQPAGKPKTKITPNQTIPTSKYKFDPYDPNPDPISTGAGQLLKALQKPGSGGGNRLLNSTSNRGNQSLFIYAVQPVETFIPFPYPMPIPQKTVDSSSPPPKPSALWRA
jgi:hypothetical protein